MARYYKVTATALIKIQDPCDKKTVEEMEDNTFIKSPFELTEEEYNFELVDAD